jgi:hypothetical protein
MHLKLISRIALAGLLLSAAAASAPAMADYRGFHGEPRVNQIDHRLYSQQHRIQAGVARGQISRRQAAFDERHVANIARREHLDQARHGGHLTPGEQHRLNVSLNRNSARSHSQRW